MTMVRLDRYQDDSISSINDFYIACDNLIEAKYIRAVSKIDEVLKSIVASKRLYNFFGRVCNGFDLGTQLGLLKRADSSGEPYLVAPEDKTRCAGFVFRLLMHIDTKERLEEFLVDIYANPEAGYTFERFARDIIPCFKSATQYLINNESKIDPVIDSVEVEQEDEDDDNVQQGAILYDTVNPSKDSLEYIVTQIIKALSQSREIDADTRQALVVQAEDLIASHRADDPQIVQRRKNMFLTYAKQTGAIALFESMIQPLERAI